MSENVARFPDPQLGEAREALGVARSRFFSLKLRAERTGDSEGGALYDTIFGALQVAHFAFGDSLPPTESEVEHAMRCAGVPEPRLEDKVKRLLDEVDALSERIAEVASEVEYADLDAESEILDALGVDIFRALARYRKKLKRSVVRVSDGKGPLS
jgi:hypothetical protein